MVLITGCNGLLGRTLAGALKVGGVDVRGLDFWKLKDSPQLDEFVMGSILDYEIVKEACEGVDTIYHLLEIENSSHYGRRFMKKVNVKGTEYILKAAKEFDVKKVVFLSSAKVYGKPGEIPVGEEYPLKPNTPYGRDKVKAEKLCGKFADKEDLDITIVRPTTITGPGTDDTMILVILYMALGMDDSNRLYIAGEGESSFQLVHPDDVAAAMITAAKVPVSRGQVYNLGSDNVPTQQEEVMNVKERARLDCEVRHLRPFFARVLSILLRPLNINYLRKEHLLFILSNFVLECGKAKKELGWMPAKGNIEILVETIEWYKKEKL